MTTNSFVGEQNADGPSDDARAATKVPRVVALDGPAASGKGSLGRRLAAHYGFAYLDTGLLYRGVARNMLSRDEDPADADAAARAAAAFDIAALDEASARTREAGAAASVVAAQPRVRAALLDYQRRFAVAPPGGADGAIIDGRDIGTVVCPEAPVKFFVQASPAERARRRWAELRADQPTLTLAEVLADLQERDARDAARADAPMRPAADAELLDTTHLSIDAVFAAARRIIDDVFTRCEC